MTESLLVLNSGSSSLKFAVSPCGAARAAVARPVRGARLAATIRRPRRRWRRRRGAFRRDAKSDLPKRSTSCSPGDGADRWPTTASSPPATASCTAACASGLPRWSRPRSWKHWTPGSARSAAPAARPRGDPLPCRTSAGPAAGRVLRHRLPSPAAGGRSVLRAPTADLDEGVRRYGFHGLSFEYVAGVLKATDPVAHSGRTVVAHLGNGASMCALRGGRAWHHDGFQCAGRAAHGHALRRDRPRGPALSHGPSRHGRPRPRASPLRRVRVAGVSEISSDMRDLLGSSDPAPGSRSTCSSTGSAASWARSQPLWVGSTRLSSRAGSARTLPRYVHASVEMRPGSGSSSTRRRTPAGDRASAVPAGA